MLQDPNWLETRITTRELWRIMGQFRYHPSFKMCNNVNSQPNSETGRDKTTVPDKELPN